MLLFFNLSDDKLLNAQYKTLSKIILPNIKDNYKSVCNVLSALFKYKNIDPEEFSYIILLLHEIYDNYNINNEEYNTNIINLFNNAKDFHKYFIAPIIYSWLQKTDNINKLHDTLKALEKIGQIDINEDTNIQSQINNLDNNIKEIHEIYRTDMMNTSFISGIAGNISSNFEENDRNMIENNLNKINDLKKTIISK